jgi:thymidine kinase
MTSTISNHRGTLYLKIGPMFSGKTTWLNGELTDLADKRFSVLKISHIDDQREDVACCDNSGSTHNSSYTELSAKIDRKLVSSLKNVDVKMYHVIGIDEAQFFDDLVETVEYWVETLGKHVRVSGLDGDCFKRKFGHVLDLIPMCDQVTKISGSCQICLDELERSDFHGNIMSIIGPFTKRLTNSISQKEIGGSTTYIPVCRYHHAQV